MASYLQTEQDAWDVPALAAAAKRRKPDFLGGAVSGAKKGAEIGALGGAKGALIGGGVGLLTGLTGAALEDEDDSEAKRLVTQALQGRGPLASLAQTGASAYSQKG